MTKFLLTACTAAAFALPAVAQTIDIDDDGWSFVDAPAQASYTVDIDDDRWTRVDMRLSGSDRGLAPQTGECTQLERSAGVAVSECGSVDLQGLTYMKGDE